MHKYVSIDPSEKSQLDALRAKARRHGFKLTKSRQRTIHCNNRGGLQLVNDRNIVVEGVDYELDIAGARYWLDRHIGKVA